MKDDNKNNINKKRIRASDVLFIKL